MGELFWGKLLHSSAQTRARAFERARLDSWWAEMAALTGQFCGLALLAWLFQFSSGELQSRADTTCSSECFAHSALIKRERHLLEDYYYYSIWQFWGRKTRHRTPENYIFLIVPKILKPEMFQRWIRSTKMCWNIWFLHSVQENCHCDVNGLLYYNTDFVTGVQ